MNEPMSEPGADVTSRITSDGHFLELSIPGTEPMRFHAIWLRDNADDPLVRDPANRQRKHSVVDLDPGLRVLSSDLDGNRLALSFSDGATVSASMQFLAASNYDAAVLSDQNAAPREIWDGSLDPQGMCASYPSISSDGDALRRWLGWVASHGFARLTDVPTRDGAVFDVIALFGYVRETNYGRLFNVRSKSRAENLAFTDLGLDPHTDNPYRDPVPTLQLLHCLENSAPGGDSIVVDGFAAAQTLKQEAPEDYRLLCETPVQFAWNGDGVSDLHATYPLLQRAIDGTITAVHINNRSMVAPRVAQFDLMPEFYRAYRHLIEITLRPEMQVSFRQEPGDLFIVDNRRVLHGRLAFDSSQGTRWLQGAYADIDGLLSKLRVLSSG